MDWVVFLAPAVGFEPTTKWLTATYSTAELRRNNNLLNLSEEKVAIQCGSVNIPFNVFIMGICFVSETLVDASPKFVL